MATSFANSENRESITEHQKPNTGLQAAEDGNAILNAARAAVDLVSTLAERHPEISVRVGLHCGPVTAGVIGTVRLQYDIWGDTVNVASRMESLSEPGRIHVSEAIANALTPCLHDSLTLLKRGEISIKGKGPMTTYWLEGASSTAP
jgi:class 3 adenylate cyclase